MKDTIVDYVERVELNERIADMDDLTTQYWARKSKDVYDEAVDLVEEHYPESVDGFEEELSNQNYDNAVELLE